MNMDLNSIKNKLTNSVEKMKFNSRNKIGNLNKIQNNLRTHSASINSKNSRNESKFSRLPTEFEKQRNVLEKILSGIKYDGFEKIKIEIENKILIKSELQNRINNLKQQKNYLNSIKKRVGTKNLVFQQESSKANHLKEVNNYFKYILHNLLI